MASVKKVVLVRHGESAWNQENKFCGWYDADLAPTGIEEAMKAGKVNTFNSNYALEKVRTHSVSLLIIFCICLILEHFCF